MLAYLLFLGVSCAIFYIWRADFQNLLHSLLHATHLQLWSQQKSQFSTKNLLQMENVQWYWLKFRIEDIKKIQILQM